MSILSKLKFLFIFLIPFYTGSVYSQSIVDSLIRELKVSKDDTVKLHILNKIVEQSTDDNVWPVYNEQMRLLGLSLMSHKNEAFRKRGTFHHANALINKGYLFNNKGMLDSSVFYYQKAAEIMKAIGNKNGVAATLNNIGYVYKSQGDILSALDYYHMSLKMYESVENLSGIASTTNNLAIIYNRQGDIKTAISYNLKSLSINEKLGNKRGEEISLGNLAMLYRKKNKYDIALSYLNKALKIQEEIDDKNGIAYSYTNIGSILEDQEKNEEALQYHLKSYDLLKTLDDRPSLASTTINLGSVYLKLGNLAKAYVFAKEAFSLSQEIGYVYELADASNLLGQVFKKQGNYKDALEMHEFYMKMKDSALNESTRKASLQKQFQYSYERKVAADSVKNMEAEKVKDAQIAAQESSLKQQRTLKYALFGGIALMIAFSLYVLNRYKNTQQKNKIIERQKAIVDEKQKEIIDSITYAKRIQLALLKEEEHVSRHLPEHFVFYRPKDIVSGDFYWSLEKKGMNGMDKFWYLTAADCTGHGVPGAFLTMLGTSFLNEINAVPELLSPAEVMEQLRTRIIKDLSQTGRIGDNKDGMDMSIIRMNLSTYELEWAGANNPLWIVRDNGTIEIKADKQPIGYADALMPFTNHKVQLKNGDQLVLFTDGFADQFGGEKKKKFKRSKLKEFVQKIAFHPLGHQKQILEKTFDDWKGDLEQIDDVCIIGVKI